jgi:intracellular sulfur oxidation DsrE/DsrF family protein
MLDETAPRRTFLATLAAAAGATLLAPLFSGRRLEAAAASKAPWDLSWLEQLGGKHRQVFEVGKLEDVPGPLHVVANYLDAWRDVYELEHPAVNTVVSIAGSGFPINAGDAIWAKYKIADKWRLSDGAGKEGTMHNVFLTAPASDAKRASVTALQARGTIFCQCNNALKAIARELALAHHEKVDAVYDELVAGLNPGVRLVPANTMLVGLAQEHGCAYEFV